MLLSFWDREGGGGGHGAGGRGVTSILPFICSSVFFHFKVMLSLDRKVGRAVPGECFELFQQTRNVAPGRARREQCGMSGTFCSISSDW